MLYQGIRSLINLMPNTYQVNVAVDEMGLDEKDKELIEFSVSYVRTMEASGHIVWKDLGACLDLLGPTYSAELDLFLSRLKSEAQLDSSRQRATPF